MQARLIAFPPDAAAITRWLQPDERLCIGRDPQCGLVLAHPSVSRTHAELYHDGEHWRLRDLDSKNGSFADGLQVRDDRLPSTCWLRLGDAYCELIEFDAQQAQSIRSRESGRRALSAAMTRQVEAQTDVASLLDEVLRGVVELAGCTRGYLLLASGDGFAVRARLNTDADPPIAGTARFSGSSGAVQRALRERKSVVVNQVSSEAWLAQRESVIDAGLQSLVCLPLLDGARTLGAVYADRSGPGEPITQFDLDLLEAFAERASLWLLTRQALQSLDDAPSWNTLVASPPRGPTP